jgi:transcriptional regulator with XRE-family HTH domain
MNNIEELKKQMEIEIENRMTLRRERLLEVIKANHLTYAQLEELTGVAKSSIQRYLTGETVKIPVDFFDRVAAVTNTPVDYLSCYDNEKNAPIKTNRDDLSEVMKQLYEENKEKVKDYADLILLKQQSQVE